MPQIQLKILQLIFKSPLCVHTAMQCLRANEDGTMCTWILRKTKGTKLFLIGRKYIDLLHHLINIVRTKWVQPLRNLPSQKSRKNQQQKVTSPKMLMKRIRNQLQLLICHRNIKMSPGSNQEIWTKMRQKPNCLKQMRKAVIIPLVSLKHIENQISIEIKERLIDIQSGLRPKEIKGLSWEEEGEDTKHWNSTKIQETNQMSFGRLSQHQLQTFLIKKQVLMPSLTGGEFMYNLNGNSLPQNGHNVILAITKKGTLVLKKIQTWVNDNTRAHHTKRFMLTKEGTLVLRRGQLFRLTLEFDRAFDSQKDIIRFIFQTGENPKPGNNTSEVFEISGRETQHGWRAELYSHDGNDTTIWIQIPPTCIVSDWWFSVETSLADAQSGSRINSFVYDHPDPIYVLFNPWCKDDTVYFPMEHMLEEYILNQSGIIFLGSRNRILCKPWNFGQFEDGVLEACMFIIKRGFNNKICPGMADPVKVCRNISTILHAEDNGVLVGNWTTNDYLGGRPPTSWSGSVAILSRYVNSITLENGNKPIPVKYGQCFVFSGLVTTICRAIGIPCRCVTSYYSGRDNDSSQTIDFNYCISQDREIVKIDTSNHDFIWKFHVWNDVWMSRPDIPLPYNVSDWQALDSTPQISSNGYHSCGPAPLTAIKDGTTHLKFDVDFLFAEVNADVLHWLRLDKSDWTLFTVETGRVGQKISTKVPDGKPLITEQDKDHIRRFTDEQLILIRQDITDTYKYAEGSWKDKNIMNKAIRAKKPEHKSKARDVEFTLERRDYVTIGMTLQLVLKMENKSTDNRNVRTFLLCETEYYSGKEADVVKQQFFETILKPSEASEVKLEAKGQEYLHKIRDHCFIKQIVIAKVKETDQTEAWLDDIMLDRPCLLLEPDERIMKGQNFQCRVSFKNPLTNKKLTNCTLSIEGSGIQAVELQQMKDVYHEFNTIVTLMPRRSKDIQISFTFHCRELGDITGFTTVVAEKDLID
ncbi:hypothetical protein CHS0354_042932 [Potamilus streckersoni]|uniref:Transglutaminase-like domain-containing protein n=1 Tax=Potamilus streckersoni TaxID=2493646 RepID=A0AAE0T538_9BIVA|nr:hypothetical protein CHS0354_042932 [Potamilus streckersoni]